MQLMIKQLSIHDGSDIYQMLSGIGKNENGFSNSAYGLSFDEFRQWLQKQQERANWTEAHGNIVPQTIFWLYADNSPVGMGKIRHNLNLWLREDGGNIGYAISSKYRRLGYGGKLLELLLEKANRMCIKEILLTIEKGNIASKLIAEKNGGTLIRENKKFWYYDCTKKEGAYVLH